MVYSQVLKGLESNNNLLASKAGRSVFNSFIDEFRVKVKTLVSRRTKQPFHIQSSWRVYHRYLFLVFTIDIFLVLTVSFAPYKVVMYFEGVAVHYIFIMRLRWCWESNRDWLWWLTHTSSTRDMTCTVWAGCELVASRDDGLRARITGTSQRTSQRALNASTDVASRVWGRVGSNRQWCEGRRIICNSL